MSSPVSFITINRVPFSIPCITQKKVMTMFLAFSHFSEKKTHKMTPKPVCEREMLSFRFIPFSFAFFL